MKNLLIIIALFLSSCGVYAQGYCPTPNEFQNKMQYFQYKAIRLMSSNVSLQEAESLSNEQDNYLNSIFPGCIQYFQTTPSPDCSKLQVLSTSYIMLDKDKKTSAKTRINNLPSSIQTKCPIDYKTMKIFTEN